MTDFVTGSALNFPSNKYGSTPNFVVPHLQKNPDVTPAKMLYAINGGVTTCTFTGYTAVNPNNSLRYLRATIADLKGNSVVADFDVAAIATPVVASVTGLDASTDWIFSVEWAENTTPQEQAKEDSFEFTVTGAKASQTATYDTTNTAGTLQVWAELVVNGVVTVANAAVADAGTAAFGNVAEDATAYAKITYKNTGTQPLQITSIVYTSGDGSLNADFANRVALPAVIAAGEIASFSIMNLDTTVGAGAITPVVITIASNTSNASYVVNFSATLV